FGHGIGSDMERRGDGRVVLPAIGPEEDARPQHRVLRTAGGAHQSLEFVPLGLGEGNRSGGFGHRTPYAASRCYVTLFRDMTLDSYGRMRFRDHTASIRDRLEACPTFPPCAFF